jgi:hypothetical protein
MGFLTDLISYGMVVAEILTALSSESLGEGSESLVAMCVDDYGAIRAADVSADGVLCFEWIVESPRRMVRRNPRRSHISLQSAQVRAHSHIIVTCSMRRTTFRLLRVQAGTLTSPFLWFRYTLCINEVLGDWIFEVVV